MNISDWDAQYEYLIRGGEQSGGGWWPFSKKTAPQASESKVPSVVVPPVQTVCATNDDIMTFAAFVWILLPIIETSDNFFKKIVEGNPYNVNSVTLNNDDKLELEIQSSYVTTITFTKDQLNEFIQSTLCQSTNFDKYLNLQTKIFSEQKIHNVTLQNEIMHPLTTAYVLIHLWAVFVCGVDVVIYNSVMSFMDKIINDDIRYFIYETPQPPQTPPQTKTQNVYLYKLQKNTGNTFDQNDRALGKNTLDKLVLVNAWTYEQINNNINKFLSRPLLISVQPSDTNLALQ